MRNGNAVSIGAWSAPLITELLTGILDEAGIPHIALPEGVRVSRRGASEIWMNFNERVVTLPDGTTMEPVSYQVRVRQ